MMDIKLVIRCREDFKKKAQYVFETFFRTIGLSYSLLDENTELTSDDIVIFYGQTFDLRVARCRVLVIRPAEEAEAYFSQRAKYKVGWSRKFHFKGREYFSLFHNEEFLENFHTAVVSSETSVEINVDLVASAFFFLSCWQEVTSDEFDRFQRFSSGASVQYQLGILDRPVVNEYFQIIRDCIEQLLGGPIHEKARFRGKHFAVCLTHDIDYARKWSPGIVYREVVKYLLLNQQRKSFVERKERFKQFLAAFASDKDPYRHSVERILEVEQEFNATSSFFFKSGATDKRDVSYSLRSGYIRNLIGRLEKRGHDVGLHPSFNAYDNIRIMRREKQRLEDVVSNKVSGVRQHFLRFQIPKTWRLHEQLGFIYDTTLGFSDIEGFRAGFCHPFQPYDVEENEVMRVWEVPLLVMDATLTDYRKLSAEESLEVFKRTILTVKMHNGIAVLLFHNTCYDKLDFAGWDWVFEKAVEFAFEQGAYLGSCREVLDLYLGA